MTDIDETWRVQAEATREVLALLGHPIERRCLPHEDHPCGGGYAEHAVAQFATIKAIADHQIDHAGMPEMAAEIYDYEFAKLVRCAC